MVIDNQKLTAKMEHFTLDDDATIYASLTDKSKIDSVMERLELMAGIIHAGDLGSLGNKWGQL